MNLPSLTSVQSVLRRKLSTNAQLADVVKFQMTGFDQTKHDIATMQQHANIPLLVSTDEEGEEVHRLLNIYPPRPSAISIYDTGDPNVAAQQDRRVQVWCFRRGFPEFGRYPTSVVEYDSGS